MSFIRSALVIAFAYIFSSTGAQATPGEAFYFQVQTSLWTTHFNPKPEHNNNQNLIGFELYGERLPQSKYQRYNEAFDYARPLLGAAWFRNSFGQKTIYAYGGIRQNLLRYGELQTYGKLTAGFIHGYRGEYQRKIPFNQLGIAPAVVPMLGAQYRRGFSEMTLFGLSGVMLTIGVSF
jgi:hypothetical protein